MSSEVSVGLTDLYFSVHGDHIMIYNPVWTRIALLSVNIITPRYGGGVYRRTRFVSGRRGRWQRRRRRRRGSALIILFRSVISAAAAAQSQPLRSSRDFFPRSSFPLRSVFTPQRTRLRPRVLSLLAGFTTSSALHNARKPITGTGEGS